MSPTSRLKFRLPVVACLVGLVAAGCDNGAAPESSENSDVARQSSTVNEPWFEEIAHSAGLDFTHENGHRVQYLMPEIIPGGAVWFDIEGDGDLDAYFIQSGSLYEDASPDLSNKLFRNDGNGTFTDITEQSGTGDRAYGMGAATGDYDNDGDVDLYVTNYGANVMYANNGDGTFTNMTVQSGTGDTNWGTSASFVDYDGDGHLDLFITNYLYWTPDIERECRFGIGPPEYCAPNAYQAPALDTLYHNNGDGTFTDVSLAAGIHDVTGNGLGVVCGDFNADGRVDIYVANDGMKNVLWINQGDGTFVNRALLTGCAVDEDGVEKAGMGVAAIDQDDDGDLDLLVVNLDNESDSFYRNEGDYFVEEAALIGLARLSRKFTRFGVGFVDFDNDGILDIYQANGRVTIQEGPFVPDGDPYAEPNILIQGRTHGRFEEVSPRGGTADDLIHVSRAAAFADFDDDGGIDILVINLCGKPYLLRNIVRERGRWIGLSVLEAHGSPAIGATVSFQAGGRNIVRDVRTGYSYLAANDPRIHVGLGEADGGATSLTVRWADGVEERFEGELVLDRYHTIRRGGGTAAN